MEDTDPVAVQLTWGQARVARTELGAALKNWETLLAERPWEHGIAGRRIALLTDAIAALNTGLRAARDATRPSPGSGAQQPPG